MNKKDLEIEEQEIAADGIPVNDKRRFNERGERIADDPPQAEPAKSAKETALEAQRAAERERREAAEAKLVGVQAKCEEARAEMRTRLKKTLEDRARQDQLNFLTTLLPVLDNLNRAVEASETDPDLGHLREGVIGTARSFEQALMSVGVTVVPSVGEVFDPEVHEAVDMVPTDAAKDGRIIAEYTRGYKFGDQLLRPARVQVGRAAAGSAGG